MSDIKKSNFQPIAIVGRGCVLPGCQSVDDLWEIIKSGRVETSSGSEDDWRVNQERLLSDEAVYQLDKMWSNHGGYVRHFSDHFDSSRFQLDKELMDQLDPVFLWSLEAARQAMAEVGTSPNLDNAGVILGNLSYPTRAHSRFAEEVWLQEMRGLDTSDVKVAAENRFMSGLPANLVARGLGFGGDTLALDAACASGLYAIKIACDRLQAGTHDIMLAGAVNAADPLFIHMGFCALNALSKTGTSQPFNQRADGLVPSEGAAFVALKRLEDARADGDKIYGVIRGVGLSNDGRSGGFLSPSTDGQVECIKKTYDMSGTDPTTVQFIECHATGTEAGDSTEITSLSTVFANAKDLPLGSLKGNLGHLITVSGIAGLLKLILAFENETIPGTPNAAPNLESVKENGFTVPDSSRKWQSTGPRIAAISSFGFGGNNAHLLVQEDSDDIDIPPQRHLDSKFAIVSLAVKTDRDMSTGDFGRRICHATDSESPAPDLNQVSLPAKSLAFPPNDLKEALGQQLILLGLLPEVEAGIANVDNHRIGVFIGMQTDSEVCRYGLRWRLQDLHPAAASIDLDREIASSPNAASVIGKMPNVPANRLSNQLNITGPGFTVSREELSGDSAIELAMSAIQRGELDAALVGAVELGNEQVHLQAMAKISKEKSPDNTADAALLMVIKSVEQAEADGDQILALIERNVGSTDVDSSVLHDGAYAASGLLKLAAGIQRLRAGLGGDDNNGIEHGAITVSNRSVFGESSSWILRPANTKAFAAKDKPSMEIYGASNTEALLANLEAGLTGDNGMCRVALVGTADTFDKLRKRAIQGIGANTTLKFWSLDGVSFCDESMEGEVASVFTGAASSYPGMGRDLFLGLPALGAELASDMPQSATAMTVAFSPANERHSLPSIQLAGSSYLCQFHARITQDMLKIKSHAAMGLSSGETNAMFAFDVWQDMDSLRSDIGATELYKTALAEEFSCVHSAWKLKKNETVEWDNFIVLAPVENVRKAIDTQERAYLTIVQSGRDTVIGGERRAIQSVLKQLGDPDTVPLRHDLAVHCSVVKPFEPIWRKLHTRPTTAPKDIRFYSNYLGGAYTVNQENVADALTGQALNTVDFPKVIEQAYKDGVRIFIEHGPRNSLSSAIDTILGDRPHLAVAMDHFAVPSMTQLYRAVASLWCAGVDVDLSNIKQNQPKAAIEAVPAITFKLRLPQIRVQSTMRVKEVKAYYPPLLSAGPATGTLMPAAPALAYTVTPVDVEIECEKNTAMAAKVRSEPIPITAPAMVKKGSRYPAKKTVSRAPKTEFAENIALSVVPAVKQTSDMNQAPSVQSVAVMQHPIPDVGMSEHQLLVEGHQHMLSAHQAFLAAQIEGQRAYQETMGRMQAVLLGTLPAPVVAPVVSTTIVQGVAPGQATKETVLSANPAPTVVAQTVKRPEADIATPDMAETPLRKSIIRPGPKFSRPELETLSSGKISSVLGPLFEQQDGYAIQVRMPEPPLLLCDRVLGIEGEAGAMGTGTIWTETEVHHDSWYLHNGRMPPGIFIESGQADLLLISWLGIDFHNKGERAYRLLGCELVFHGELPKPGEILEYEIRVDGHAKQGDVRLFFFHYDCHINGELRISVKNGQAGFFTKGELAESAGVLWEADTADYTANVAVAEASASCHKSAFSRADIAHYLKGDLQACFGDEFRRAHTHTRTPGSPEGQGNFLGEVTHFDPTGGPRGRGYLRIIEDINEDDWFFKGHFNNDPCMPGTLMADACLQAMAFYMSARGHTLHKDGWRFQPVRGTNYKFVCRGQALPESKQLVYEIFIDEEIIDQQPQLFAHVLCTIDGRKAFLCERLGLQLVPDWPLSSMPELLEHREDDRPLAYIDDFPLDYRSLINCAWGKPSTAFGEGFAHYDGPLRSPRLPGPPYHFMTRIVALEGEMASMKKGGRVEAIYDIPEDAWYFDDNASRTIPFCVLMEIALQPCGWLASYTLGRDFAESDLLFRNLDGTGTQHREIVPCDGTIKTIAKLTSFSKIGDLIIENFEVECTIGGEPVYTMKTVFGFFPPDAMANQKGLTITPEEKIIFDQASNEVIDLTKQPTLYFDHPSAHLPDSKLLMVDRITFLDNSGGKENIGSIRGEKDVDITEWFFKAHFFQDPVQPGSLGIEAMLQVMQALMISQGLHERFSKPRFEPVLIKGETEWHYRGQITPDKALITIDFQCNERIIEDDNTWITGDARLWGDGLKIYHAPRIGLRIVEDDLDLASVRAPGTASNKTISRSLEKTQSTVEASWRGVRDYWIQQSAGEHFLVHDLGAALIHQFVRDFKLLDSNAFQARKGQPAIYLANHQVGVESFLFLGMIAAMTSIPAEAIAKQEHRDSWLGQIAQLTETELKEQSTTRMLFFDREDQSDMLRILNHFGETVHEQPRSLLVHVDGTRATEAGLPTEKVSSVLIDLAIKYQISIVPVRFAGGLPLEASAARLEFPVGFGAQDYYIGAAIEPGELETLPYVERAKKVLSLINSVGPMGNSDNPIPGDEKFIKMVGDQAGDRSEIQQVLWSALKSMPNLGIRMENLLAKIENGKAGKLSPAEKIMAKLLG